MRVVDGLDVAARRLLRKLNAKDYVSAATEIGTWRAADPLAGLLRRRQAETALLEKARRINRPRIPSLG
jgi:GH24 family phage-related lysozyme (muramidase)